jgi:integrase
MGVTIRKRNGKWFIFVNYRGRRKAKCIGASRQLAEQVKRQLEAKLTLGDLGFLAEAPKTVTFAEYSQRWLTQRAAEVDLKDSTVASYKQLLRLYVLPAFGRLAVNGIERSYVKQFLGDWSQKATLSRNTLRLMMCTLRVILNGAVEDGIIDRNPAEKLGRFTKTEKPDNQAQAMTREEAQAFLTAAIETRQELYPLFLMALRAGLRKGELIALKWGDIQFGGDDDSNRYILVQRNYVQGRFTTPKSKKSRRVDLSKQLRRALLELRDKRMLEAFMAGRPSISDDLVFPSKANTPLDANNLVHYHFQPLLESAGLRHFRFHDLRHTFGSLLIQDGASLSYVKEQMGHASIKVTADTYGHLIPGADINWIDRLDREASPQPNATQAQPEQCDDELQSLEVVEKDGERGRNRTYNLLIKS